MHILDATMDFGENAEGLFLKTTQEIDHDLLDCLKEKRMASRERTGELMHVASVPVVLVEKWLREGFNIYQAPAREIVARLQREDLGAFLATTRRV
jgi:hypothetical protein